MKILVAEDNLDARMLCAKALRIEEHEVREASSGLEALGELEKNFKPDLILLDLSMPDMDGEQFMSRLRAVSEWKEIRVVLVSGHDGLRSLARKLGADDFLRKPFGLDELYQVIERIDRGIRAVAKSSSLH